MSHQFPVVVVDVEVVDVVASVGVGVVIRVDVGVDAGVDVLVVVDVDVTQDAKTSDVIMRQVSSIKIAPLFIRASFLMEDFWGIGRNRGFGIF